MYPQNTPMVTRQVSRREIKQLEDDSKNDQDFKSPLSMPYREVVESLLYLAGATRPDITYAVNVFSRHQVNPTEVEYDMAIRVLRY